MNIRKLDAGVWVKASDGLPPLIKKQIPIRWLNGSEYFYDSAYIDNEGYKEIFVAVNGWYKIEDIEWLKPVTGYLLTEDELEKYTTGFLGWIASKNYSRGEDRQKKYWFDKNGEGVGTTKEIYKQFIQIITNQ